MPMPMAFAIFNELGFGRKNPNFGLIFAAKALTFATVLTMAWVSLYDWVYVSVYDY